MVSKMIVDVVIGTKYCRKCNSPVVVESHSVPGAIDLLTMYPTCSRMLTTPDGEPLEYYKCDHGEFTAPRFAIKMKKDRPWVKEVLNRLSK